MVGFLWPAALWGLVGVAALAGGLWWIARRRLERGFLHTGVAELRASVSLARGPLLLYFGALTAVVIASARPLLPLWLPVREFTVVLSVDTSGSMRSRDVHPNRLEAAKKAAKDFLQALPRHVAVGLVGFAGTAQLLQPPTVNRERVLESLESLGFAPRTAIGEGLLEAVAALPGRVRPRPDGTVPYQPSLPRAAVILLSDGRNNTGIDPLEAAQVAVRQNVTVYTVGVGRPAQTDAVWTIGGPLDEHTLKQVARITGGEYFHASSAQALASVYRRLAHQVSWETRQEEVSGLAALLAAALLVAGVYGVARAHRVL